MPWPACLPACMYERLQSFETLTILSLFTFVHSFSLQRAAATSSSIESFVELPFWFIIKRLDVVVVCYL